MKKTSIALIIGLVCVGCEKAPPKTNPAPPMHDPAQMMKAHAATAHAPAVTEEKKVDEGVKIDEVKPEVDGASVEPAPKEEK